MKRVLTLAFILIALTMWTVPSFAEVTFSGQYRLRAEQGANSNFDGDVNDDYAFWGQRVRLSANAAVGSDASFKLTLQDSRNWGVGSSTAGPGLTETGVSMTDLHEAYLQIKDFFGTPLTLKAGRQELAYGDERLIGSFGWSNNGRSFDALKLTYGTDAYSVDFFTSKIVDGNTAEDGGVGAIPETGMTNDLDLYGIYATLKGVPNNTIDVYALLLKDTSATTIMVTALENYFAPVTDEGQLYTYGARLKGAAAGLEYTAEVALQSGETESTTGGTDYDISAMAYALKLAYAIPGDIGLKVGAEYDFASGDDDGGDDEIGTFSNLYPTNHDKLGYMDESAWRNITALNVNVSAKPTPALSVRLDYWSFELAEETDLWYDTGNAMTAPLLANVLRTGGSTETEIGTEVDITLNYKYNDAIGIQAGISRFMTGALIDDIMATPEDQDWAYVQLTANF